MLSVSVHKDIGEYSEKVVGKLSARTLVCVVGGLAASVGTAAIVYFCFGIPVSNATLPVMAASMPFWLAGFWRPKGLKAEAFLPLYFRHLFTGGKLVYTSGFLAETNLFDPLAQKPDRKATRRAKREGAECRAFSL